MDPCTPAVRSITGVDVIPISGTTCGQPWLSLGVSPAASRETCQSGAPESASNACTEPCSVATYTTSCGAPPIVSCETYRGCASTLPSTFRLCSRPKELELT